jgi:hypothetical protein
MKECFECGTIDDLQEHHVVPRSRGGTKTVTLCYSCHMKAHGRDSKGLQHGRLTKKALQVAKSRGVKLGSANPKTRQAHLNKTTQLLERVEPIILKAENEGCRTIQSFCDYLNDRDIKTTRGKDWTTGTMHRILKKILENK